jgi:hypothetical protein
MRAEYVRGVANAQRVAREAILAVAEGVRPGDSEREVCARIERELSRAFTDGVNQADPYAEAFRVAARQLQDARQLALDVLQGRRRFCSTVGRVTLRPAFDGDAIGSGLCAMPSFLGRWQSRQRLPSSNGCLTLLGPRPRKPRGPREEVPPDRWCGLSSRAPSAAHRASGRQPGQDEDSGEA